MKTHDNDRAAASVQEARAWLDFHPCACGSRKRRAEEVTLDVDAERPALGLAFMCGGCCGRREFTFDASLFYPEGSPGGAAFSSLEGPSRLLDPIQYFHIAFHHGRQIPADLGALDRPDQVREARVAAAWALAALCEARKFFRSEKLDVDPTWGQDSQRLLEAHPERYTLSCLLCEQESLCDALETLERLALAEHLRCWRRA